MEAVPAREDVGFYFRLSLLVELSTFFATLPPAGAGDLVDGDIPLIPLQDIRHDGLLLLLLIRSLTSPEPFQIPDGWRSPTVFPWFKSVAQSITHAAIAAKLYQLPIAYRLLLDCAARAHEVNPYLAYAVWAVAEVDSQLPSLARQTLGPRGHISQVDRAIVRMCQTHAPRAWAELLDLHHRYSHAAERFNRKLSLSSTRKERLAFKHAGCEEEGDVAAAIRRRLNAGRTVREKLAVGQNEGFGLECETCMETADAQFGGIISWLEDFAYELRRDDEGDI